MTTVALLVGLRLSPALAAQYNSAPPHQNAGGKPSSPLSNNAYTVSTALSTALSVGGTANAGSVNANLANQSNAVLSGKKGPAFEFNNAPTVQTAVGTAVSIGGNASAAAINSDGISLGNMH